MRTWRLSAVKSNVAKLIIHKFSVDAIPSDSGLVDGVRILSDPDAMKRGMEVARRWAIEAIDVVKTAPDNPWGDDDEAIAGEILRRIEEARQKRWTSMTG